MNVVFKRVMGNMYVHACTSISTCATRGLTTIFCRVDNYISEHTTKIQIYNVEVRQNGLCCHNKIKDVIVEILVQFNWNQMHILNK